MTYVDCEHEKIDWGYVFSSGDQHEQHGRCHACGLIIHEENGVYRLFNGQIIRLRDGLHSW
jgi:hypothetical protein